MDVEDEEPSPNESPPSPSLQQQHSDQPPFLSTNAEPVIVPENNDDDTAVAAQLVAADAMMMDEAVVPAAVSGEGGEMLVMDGAGMEMEDVIVEDKGNEGTDVDVDDSMAVETGRVEEEPNFAIGEEPVRGEETNEAAFMEEEEEEQQGGEGEEQQQGEEGEEEEQPGGEGEEQQQGEEGEEEEAVQGEHEVEPQQGEEEQVEEEHQQDEEEGGEEEEEQEEERLEEDGEEEEEEQQEEERLEEDGEEEQQEGEEEGGEEEEGDDEERQEEEEDAGVDGGVAEATEFTEVEETDAMEEQSVSVSGGKRKRGSGKNPKPTGRVPSKKKMEEDVCFICFDGGELVLCDRRGCPKAYHPSCINRDEAFFRAKGKWNCGWHLCSICEKNAYYMCYTCTFSLCKGCIKDAAILCVRGNKGFCETCMRTVTLIEQNEQGNNMGQVDFDDKNSWEYLFKDYYIDLKGKLSLTCDKVLQAKNPWKGSDMLLSKEESRDELFDASNDRGSDSDSSYEKVDLSRSKKRKAKKKAKSRSKEGSSNSAVTVLGADRPSADESFEWASKELLEFVMHMRDGDRSALSQFDVQALLLEYIKRNKLRDPRRKSQIICDVRLQNLFGKPRVGHFEMLKLLESHFLLKEDSQAEDQQGSVVDTEVSHLEGDGNVDSYLKSGKDKKRRSRKKGDERGLHSNIDDYAAIDNHNISLIYLRRNLVEDLLEDTENFQDKAVGSFVRIRISGSAQKQDLYRLVQVVGTCKATEPYKVGKRMTDIMLEILNLNKTEIVSIDIISNQEFTEDECKRLRQSIKCGLINRLTVGDIQDKALTLQAVRVKDWLETETVRLSHLRDRASEKGRRKELRECVEKLQLLKTPEERQRRLEEIPEIHVDPKMDPSYESEEDEDEMEDKRQDNYMKPRGSTAFGRRGREIASPRSGSSDSWSGTRSYSNVNQELSRNLSNKGFSIKGDDASIASEALNDAQLLQGRDRESQLSSSWERQKQSSSFESGAKSTQPLVTSESFSTALLEASAAPSSTGTAPQDVKINETEKMWHYQDPSGKVQGPFSIVQLRKWNNTGYFPADLKIWKTAEKQDESILLKDALAGKFSKEPSIVDKTPPKAQAVHDLHYSTSYTGKSHLAAQNSTLGSLASRTSQLAVEVPKNPRNGWGSDAGVRNESTNLPSPTPQTTPGGTKGQAFENQWSPTPVQLAGSHLGNSFSGGRGGLQASMVMLPQNIAQNAENGLSSQPGMTLEQGMLSSTGTTQVHPQATAMAHVLPAGANMQNQVVSSHNSHAQAQGWGSALVPKPEQQAWGGAPSQRVEPTTTMPVQPASHGPWSDVSSFQNSASFASGNPAGNLPMPGLPGMTTPEPWRPPASSTQPNIAAAAAPPNIPWGMGMPGNQSTGWGGALPSNMNVNWTMPAQVPVPGNANPGWTVPTQGLPPVNAAGWVAPGQGLPHVNANANAGWVVPGQGLAPGSANPGWGASAGNPGIPNQGDRGVHGGDSGYGGKSWNRQSSFGGGGGRGGGSSRPPGGGQRGICRFHESGRCRKGASCDYIHN